MKQIYKDGGRLVKFNDIRKVHIKRIFVDGSDEFLLTLVPEAGRKIKVGKSSEEDLELHGRSSPFLL